jgi:hypothetical protein
MGFLPYDITLKATLWIATMCFLAIDGILFVIKASKVKQERKLKRDIFRALAIFCFSCIVERNSFGESELYFRFLGIAYTFAGLALQYLIVVGEREIINTKYAISFTNLFVITINIIFLIFFPNLVRIIRYINYILVGIEVGIIFIIYLYLIKKYTGELRKIALLTLIALSLISSAYVLQTDYLISTGLISPYFSQVFFIIGLTLLAYEIIQKEGLDLLELIAKHKMTTLSKDFWEIIDQFGWKQKEKVEFIKDMIGLTPHEREKILKDMLTKFKRPE